MPAFTYLEDMLVAQLRARKAAGCEKSATATGQCLATVLSGKVSRLVKGEAASPPPDPKGPAPQRG